MNRPPSAQSANESRFKWKKRTLIAICLVKATFVFVMHAVILILIITGNVSSINPWVRKECDIGKEKEREGLITALVAITLVFIIRYLTFLFGLMAVIYENYCMTVTFGILFVLYAPDSIGMAIGISHFLWLLVIVNVLIVALIFWFVSDIHKRIANQNQKRVETNVKPTNELIDLYAWIVKYMYYNNIYRQKCFLE